uniref:Glycosyltransferase family 28 N-terminal domain-containing protein n=3 Tax=Lotharella globosa TaxID=91324 RepID=A0A7S4DUG1_9EUKA
MSRAKDLLGDMKDRLAAIKAKPDLTFWEWMNLVCPAKEDRNVNNITEIGDIRTLAGEIIGLPKSDIEVLKKMCPKMNIVIMICGSRGDVQPFLPIGQALKNLGHRVRIATHANFREFVESNGCEFYPLGGDPKKLMAYMVKSKGKLMPSTSELLSSSFWEETAERKEMMEEIIMSCYDAANCADKESKGSAGEPFTADFIISNPTTYSHVHLAEAMGVPVHMFFTMPWSPTSQFPHPLGGVAYKELTGKDKKKFEASPDKGDVKDMDSFLENFQKIQATKSKKSDANSYSYKSVDWLMHMGMGELLQKFRVKHNLTKTWKEGADIVNSRGLPFAYIWSPSLIPKPEDWGANIDIVGFCELKGSGFTGEPPADIKAWLEKDPEKPPIFIGFGSCVLPDPRKVAKNIYYAAQKADVRVIIQQGWAELGKSLTGKDGVSFVKGTKLDDGSESEGYDIKANDFALVIGRVSHSWLFDHVTGVVHHGGAGTTYAGLKAAKPTFVAPFFGDQPFWGQMVSAAGAGPKPQGVDDWEEESLAKKFLEMCGEPMKKAAKGLSDAMAKENGAAKSIDAIYSHLYFHQLHCGRAEYDTYTSRTCAMNLHTNATTDTQINTHV